MGPHFRWESAGYRGCEVVGLETHGIKGKLEACPWRGKKLKMCSQQGSWTPTWAGKRPGVGQGQLPLKRNKTGPEFTPNISYE